MVTYPITGAATNLGSWTSTPALNMGSGYGQTPIYDRNGRITGYRTIQTSTAPNSARSASTGIYNPGGLLAEPLLAGTSTPLSKVGPTANNPYSNPLNPNGTATDASDQPKFNLLQTTKNPAIQSNIDAAAKTEGDISATTNQNFQSYLAAAKESQKQQTADVATDTTTLQNLPANLSKSLGATNQQYADAANAANTTYQNLNKTNANTVSADISRLSDLNDQYASANQDAVNLGEQQALGAINARSINPSGSAGNSSDYMQAVIGNNVNAQTALQANLSAQRISQLTNYITPLQQQLYDNNVSQNQFATQVAQTIAGMQTGSAEQVAALTQAVAGRPAQEQQSLLASLGIPLSVQQQVMASVGNSIGALTSADNANNFYGLDTQYDGQSVVLPNYQQPNAPSFANTGSYANPYGRGNLAPTLPAPTAPGITSGTQPMGATAGGYSNGLDVTRQGPEYQYGTPQFFAASRGYTPNGGVVPQNLTPQQMALYRAGLNPYANPAPAAPDTIDGIVPNYAVE